MVGTTGGDHLFLFSPAGVRAFYALPEALITETGDERDGVPGDDLGQRSIMLRAVLRAVEVRRRGPGRRPLPRPLPASTGLTHRAAAGDWAVHSDWRTRAGG